MEEQSPNSAIPHVPSAARNQHVAHTGLKVGDDVEVLCRSVTNWASGFSVARTDQTGIWLRRNSDGSEIPVPFTSAQIRPRR